LLRLAKLLFQIFDQLFKASVQAWPGPPTLGPFLGSMKEAYNCAL